MISADDYHTWNYWFNDYYKNSNYNWSPPYPDGSRSKIGSTNGKLNPSGLLKGI